MKRLLLLVTVLSATFTFTSCEGDRGPAGPAGPHSLVVEITGNMGNQGGEYIMSGIWANEIGGDLYDEESVLVYRLTDVVNGNPVWQLIPRTMYVAEGTFDYDFDFTKVDFFIYAGTDEFDLGTTPQYTNNQTFRLVIIPGQFANRGGVNFENYSEVIQYYGLDDSKVKTIRK